MECSMVKFALVVGEHVAIARLEEMGRIGQQAKDVDVVLLR